MSENQPIVYKQIRLHLETRLAQILKTEREAMPALSLAEIVSLLFAFHGHQNVLGGFGQTVAAIQALVGEDLVWKRPTPEPTPPTEATIN